MVQANFISLLRVKFVCDVSKELGSHPDSSHNPEIINRAVLTACVRPLRPAQFLVPKVVVVLCHQQSEPKSWRSKQLATAGNENADGLEFLPA